MDSTLTTRIQLKLDQMHTNSVALKMMLGTCEGKERAQRVVDSSRDLLARFNDYVGGRYETPQKAEHDLRGCLNSVGLSLSTACRFVETQDAAEQCNETKLLFQSVLTSVTDAFKERLGFRPGNIFAA